MHIAIIIFFNIALPTYIYIVGFKLLVTHYILVLVLLTFFYIWQLKYNIF